MIDVYITHFVTSQLHGINDILVDQIIGMRRTMPLSAARIRVICWTDDWAYVDDLRRRLDLGVEIVVNDRPGRPDTQPSMRNKVLELARASDCEAFILLHNDVRPARGWFGHLVNDWRKAERQWGPGSAIVTPRYIPYHLLAPEPQAIQCEAFWHDMRTIRGRSVLTGDQMAAWCKQHGFQFLGVEVDCPANSSLTDDGHQLMMFIASPRCFDDVGDCDERYLGVNYDDCDWGIRAILAGKRNLKSTGALIGHVEGLTFFTPEFQHKVVVDNAKIFIEKWGQAMFDEMQTGALWLRLHREQGA